jgi:solute carrier family 10 (sodium/bile acid cotransporter), member 7
MLARIDPVVRLILAAMLLASLLPVSGAARPVVQGIADVGVFVLFGLYGLKLARADVRAGLANLRLLVPLALWVFGVMALAGWGLWQAFSGVLPPLLALGFLYLGVLPSTVQSATVYTSQAGGNVAMSVIAAALLNLLGVVVTAPLFALMAGTAGGGLHAATFVKVATMMLLPFVLGQALQGLAGAWVRAHKPTVSLLERGTIGLAVYVSFSGAVTEGVWQRIDAASWGWLALGCGGLLVLGYGGSWLLARLLGLSHADRIAMVFAGAQKSLAMGAPLASVRFKPSVAGMILLPLVVYHLAQMIVAAPVAARLRRE